MGTKLHRAVLVAGLLAAPVAGALPVVEVALGPAGSRELRVEPGSIVAATVRMDAVPAGSDGKGLFGMGFSLLFDAAGLAPATPALGPLWDGKGFSSARIGPGEVAFTANRFFEASGPAGSNVVLVTLSFQVLAEGRFTLALGPYTGPGDNILYDGTALDGGPGFFTSSALVGVPEPGTLALTALGLTLLAARRHDREREGAL